ncbi:hypothetical protein ScPMuIL_009225 [Solemya velum]
MSFNDDWGASVDSQETQLASEIGKMGIKKEIKTEPSTNGSGPVQQKPTSPAKPTSAPPVQHGAQAGDSSQTEEDETELGKEDESLLRKLIHSKLIASKSDLDILQKDPNSPLFSVKSFEALNLKPELLKGVYAMGFNAPSKIQETALPTLLADPPVNMIAQSQSGTGKTAAFVLTMLSRVDTSQSYPQCLCLAPTFELALQIGEVVKSMSKYMSELRVLFAVRGEKIERGHKLDQHIIIGTPGTLMDWALKFKFFDLKRIKVFVLDEADVMIATQGHQDQSIRIQRGLGKDCQMLLFSATYVEDVMKFAQAVIPNKPIVIKLRREEESLENIKQYYIECSSKEEKFQAIANIYGAISIGQSMIFCATKKTAHWLTEKMSEDGHVVGLLTGDLMIEQRAAIIKRFREGKEKVLITTNVTARGIDIEQVTVVVNFDLPLTHDMKPDCETYIHRIGRTGRFGKNGLAINLIDGNRSYNTMRAIEKHFGRTIEKLDADDIDAIEKIST